MEDQATGDAVVVKMVAIFDVDWRGSKNFSIMQNEEYFLIKLIRQLENY